MKPKHILFFAALLGAVGVILGAFGAHALENSLSTDQLDIYQTGVQYHYIHTLALLGTGLWALQLKGQKTVLGTAALFFLLGILFFSGSLYLLAIRELINIGFLVKVLGPMTPIGGLFFIVGWGIMAWQAIRN